MKWYVSREGSTRLNLKCGSFAAFRGITERSKYHRIDFASLLVEWFSSPSSMCK